MSGLKGFTLKIVNMTTVVVVRWSPWESLPPQSENSEALVLDVSLSVLFDVCGCFSGGCTSWILVVDTYDSWCGQGNGLGIQHLSGQTDRQWKEGFSTCRRLLPSVPSFSKVIYLDFAYRIGLNRMYRMDESIDCMGILVRFIVFLWI